MFKDGFTNSHLLKKKRDILQENYIVAFEKKQVFSTECVKDPKYFLPKMRNEKDYFLLWSAEIGFRSENNVYVKFICLIKINAKWQAVPFKNCVLRQFLVSGGFFSLIFSLL